MEKRAGTPPDLETFRSHRPLTMAEGVNAPRALRRGQGSRVEVPKEAADRIESVDPGTLDADESPQEGKDEAEEA